MRTGFQSLKMGSSFYFLPMFFLFSPLISGTPVQIIMTFIVGTAAVYLFVAAIEGFLSVGPAPAWMRLCCLAGALLLFFSCVDGRIDYVEPIKAMAGLAIGAVMLATQRKKYKSAASPAA